MNIVFSHVIHYSSFISTLPDDVDGDLAEDLAGFEDRGIMDHDESDLDLNDDDDDEMGKTKTFGEQDEPEQSLWVLPMYSMLPPEKQRMVSFPTYLFYLKLMRSSHNST